MVARAGSDGRTRNRIRVVYCDIHGRRAVIVVVSATGNLRVVNLFLCATDVLYHLEIKVGVIGGAPKADLGGEGAVGLNQNFRQFLPAERRVRNQFTPEPEEQCFVEGQVSL